MPPIRGYKSFEDFERELIRPGMRIGWSVDELDEAAPESELDFDADPFDSSDGDDDDSEGSGAPEAREGASDDDE